MNKEMFIPTILDNWSKIMDEYNQMKSRTIPLPGFDDDRTLIKEWRAATLWWNYKPFKRVQAEMPFTTSLVSEGPSHRATGWLLLSPHSRTPVHNHKEWGRKIIVHIPTHIPEGDTGFWVEGKIHRWKMGEPFAFDCTTEHYGFNNTDETRSIMVMDFDYDEWYPTLKKYMPV